MSGTQEKSAQEVIFDRVYIPTFIAKCASHGLELPDGESVHAALESVAMLKASEQSKAQSLTKSAHDALRSAMNIPSPEDIEAAQRKQAQEKQASDQMLSDPQLRAALDAILQAKA